MNKTSNLTVQSFDHVTLICANLEATRRFYVDVLGMAQVERPAFSFPGVWFQVGGVQIHATEQNTEAGAAGWADRGAQIVARGHHLAFAVENVELALKHVLSLGVKLASPLQQRPDGFRQAYVYDPDGHVIELVSR